ncbi:MAG: hypothetical protein ACHQU8_02735 [Gemmatimonadales bacterium]
MMRYSGAVLIGVLVPALAIAGRRAEQPLASQGPFGPISLEAAPPRFQGRCPAHLRFTATIAVSVHPMVFNYQFERSDGAKSQLRVVRVPANGPATYRFSEQWQVGAAGQHMQVWEKLKVASGVTHVETDPMSVDITCR